MSSASTMHPPYQCRVEIKNRRGLHARASAKIVKAVMPFQADVRICFEDKEVLATSIMGLMFLGAMQGSFIEIKATGTEAKAALEVLEKLINERFSEET